MIHVNVALNLKWFRGREGDPLRWREGDPCRGKMGSRGPDDALAAHYPSRDAPAPGAGRPRRRGAGGGEGVWVWVCVRVRAVPLLGIRVCSNVTGECVCV